MIILLIVLYTVNTEGMYALQNENNDIHTDTLVQSAASAQAPSFGLLAVLLQVYSDPITLVHTLNIN